MISFFKKRTRLTVSFVIFFIIMILFTVFGGRGLITLINLNERKREISKNIDALTEENKQLKSELMKLKGKEYKERTVRSKMGMVKPGETIYIFSDK